MRRRKRLPTKVEKKVLIASTRRCCLCVFLDHRDGVRKGQIAHLNHNPNDHRFENLVWLCLEHHDDYDGRPSQSKGFRLARLELIGINSMLGAILRVNDTMSRLSCQNRHRSPLRTMKHCERVFRAS
jgi:hypothetical protein